MPRRTAPAAGPARPAAGTVPLREALGRLEDELAVLARLAADLDAAIGAAAQGTRDADAGTRRALQEADRLRQTAEDLAVFTRAVAAGVPANLPVPCDPARTPLKLGQLAARLHGWSPAEAGEAAEGPDGDIQLF